MKTLPIVVALFFIFFLIISGIFFLKLNSLEKRLLHIPDEKSIDQRLRSIRSSLETLEKAHFKSYMTTCDRLSALETGVSRPHLEGSQSVESLMTSLQFDYFAFKDTFSEPETKTVLEERLEKTIGELEKKTEAGEDALTPLFNEIETSDDSLWKIYLLSNVVWRMGPESKDRLMSYTMSEKNEDNLRVVAAKAVMKRGGRRELKKFAKILESPEESLTVKTGLARIFREHPCSAAEPGLIEGVRGKKTDDGEGLAPYHPEHRYACLRALRFHDSPRVIRFLEEVLHKQCRSGPDQEKDPLIAVLALDAYGTIKRKEAVPFLKMLIENNPDLDNRLIEKINNIIDSTANEETP